MSNEPIGFTADADTWCPECAREAYGPAACGECKECGAYIFPAVDTKCLKCGHDFSKEPLTDNERNPLGAIFSWDEWDGGCACGVCGEVIVEAPEEEEE